MATTDTTTVELTQAELQILSAALTALRGPSEAEWPEADALKRKLDQAQNALAVRRWK